METVCCFRLFGGVLYLNEQPVGLSRPMSRARIDNVCIATGRQKLNAPIPDAVKGRPPKYLTPKGKMTRGNRTKKGAEEYVWQTVVKQTESSSVAACSVRGALKFWAKMGFAVSDSIHEIE